jgi:3-hydroxyacyl-[acyl-carrier-protein] dehydratase
MPPQTLFDLTAIDLNHILFDVEEIRKTNPQRGDMEQLNAIVHIDPENGQILGYKEVRSDEFWVAGHIPGRPLLPGVLMIEAAAQLASFYTKRVIGWEGFIGFGGVEECKFRQQVQPGCRLYLLAKLLWNRHKRIRCQVQGLVDDTIVFETGIIGVQF